ncbi:MAG: hypothetical protein AAB846_02065, partial [Patescibacteria group bacterium]
MPPPSYVLKELAMYYFNIFLKYTQQDVLSNKISTVHKKSAKKKKIWCPGGESNSHALRHTILS